MICLITACRDPEHELCAAARTSAAPAAEPTTAAAAEAPTWTLQGEQAVRGEKKQSERTRERGTHLGQQTARPAYGLPKDGAGG